MKYVSRSVHEKQAKFNSVQKPLREECYANESDNDKTVRFPSRPKQEQLLVDKNIDLTMPMSPTQNRRTTSHFQPSRYHGRR